MYCKDKKAINCQVLRRSTRRGHECGNVILPGKLKESPTWNPSS